MTDIISTIFSKKKKKEVIKGLIKVIKENPKDPTNYLQLGQLYMEIDNKEEGIKALFKSAELFAKEAFFSKAIAIYKKIEQIEPDHPLLPANIRSTHEKTGEYYSESKKVQHEKLSQETYSLIFQSELFSSLENVEFEQIIRISKLEKYIPGQIIISEGELGDSMYFIISGRVKVITKNVGETIELGYLEEKDFFGEVSILTEQPRTATIVGLTSGELLVLNKNDLQDLFKKNPDFQRKVEEFYQKRVYNTIDIFLKKLK
ncbi:MAG: hypothetical protein A2Y62_10225 [Candidatus Fischerbacteria bacterium RBG_13_37_8]|uniref:Cyclic nucleotide-binding domain-containing protein n=1 Tax=Candidatus Fischerbacteria bacterium RBG_13_37_8 TaxID=1817863 RepID=A0A1F5V5Z8_9BACT|nr:MAG: hypothetical protein A2Y62_10225 [Candidatus Fischerbacteria bacterium RBG_13_37_8]